MIHELNIFAGEEKQITLLHDKAEQTKRIINLCGRGAKITIDEIFLSKGVHSELEINHQAPNTTSLIRSRGVLDKEEFALAHAKITIPKHALHSKTLVEQRFLLLEKSAAANILPSLEIEAKDVDAKHKTTIAPISEQSIFYLTSRGFEITEARKLIIAGFLQIPETHKHMVTKWN